jgi:hypothetical protein
MRKRHKHICDDCDDIYVWKSKKNDCLTCDSQICSNCSSEHHDICKRASYDYLKDSIKKLENWKYKYIQIRCPKCFVFKFLEYSNINPLSFICEICYQKQLLPFSCPIKPIYLPFTEFVEGNNTPIILYQKIEHTYLCIVCGNLRCACSYVHNCLYLNHITFYPRIAYVYNPIVCAKVMTILLCFRRMLPEIHRNTVWDNVINYLNWKIK